MFGFFKSLFAAFTPPKPAGPPKLVQAIGVNTALISDNATWSDHAIVVTSDSADTVKILELPLKNLEQCLLGLKFLMSSSEVSVGAYPEMWVKVQGFGEAFSKGLNFRLKGSNDWTSCELPFYLKKSQPASLLKLNVTFQGSGSILLKDIKLYSTPLE